MNKILQGILVFITLAGVIAFALAIGLTILEIKSLF